MPVPSPHLFVIAFRQNEVCEQHPLLIECTIDCLSRSACCTRPSPLACLCIQFYMFGGTMSGLIYNGNHQPQFDIVFYLSV